MTDQPPMDVNTLNATASPVWISELVPYCDMFYYMTVSLHVITFILGILSNSLYCTVIIRYPQFRKSFNLLAFALAVSDLLASMISVPLVDTLVNYHYQTRSLDTPICKINILAVNLFKWFSVLLMIEIAVIRAKSILSTTRWTISVRHIVHLVFFNISLTIPFSIYRTFLNKNIICYPLKYPHNALVNTSIGVSFFTVLLIGYVLIIIEAKRRAAKMPESSRNRANRFEISTLRACAAVVGSYILCHFPYFIYTALVYIEVVQSSYYYHAFFVSVFQLTYAFNSLILTISSSEYRKHIVRILCSVHPCNKSQ